MNTFNQLLSEKPWLRNLLQHLECGQYSLEELYEFNPFTSDNNPEGLVVSEPGQLNGLTERYKASLMLKAQVQLLIRLEERNLLSLW